MLNLYYTQPHSCCELRDEKSAQNHRKKSTETSCALLSICCSATKTISLLLYRFLASSSKDCHSHVVRLGTSCNGALTVNRGHPGPTMGGIRTTLTSRVSAWNWRGAVLGQASLRSKSAHVTQNFPNHNLMEALLAVGCTDDRASSHHLWISSSWQLSGEQQVLAKCLVVQMPWTIPPGFNKSSAPTTPW